MLKFCVFLYRLQEDEVPAFLFFIGIASAFAFLTSQPPETVSIKSDFQVFGVDEVLTFVTTYKHVSGADEIKDVGFWFGSPDEQPDSANRARSVHGSVRKEGEEYKYYGLSGSEWKVPVNGLSLGSGKWICVYSDKDKVCDSDDFLAKWRVVDVEPHGKYLDVVWGVVLGDLFTSQKIDVYTYANAEDIGKTVSSGWVKQRKWIVEGVLGNADCVESCQYKGYVTGNCKTPFCGDEEKDIGRGGCDWPWQSCCCVCPTVTRVWSDKSVLQPGEEFSCYVETNGRNSCTTCWMKDSEGNFVDPNCVWDEWDSDNVGVFNCVAPGGIGRYRLHAYAPFPGSSCDPEVCSPSEIFGGFEVVGDGVPVCGNIICEMGENANNCPQDCLLKQLTCKNEYKTSWHLGPCNPNNCQSGYTFVGCEEKWFIWHREVCEKIYETSCEESPSCGEDEVIGEETCEIPTPPTPTITISPNGWEGYGLYETVIFDCSATWSDGTEDTDCDHAESPPKWSVSGCGKIEGSNTGDVVTWNSGHGECRGTITLNYGEKSKAVSLIATLPDDTGCPTILDDFWKWA